jgi:hypothetical protein
MASFGAIWSKTAEEISVYINAPRVIWAFSLLCVFAGVATRSSWIHLKPIAGLFGMLVTAGFLGVASACEERAVRIERRGSRRDPPAGPKSP